jgi:hypothetical protein
MALMVLLYGLDCLIVLTRSPQAGALRDVTNGATQRDVTPPPEDHLYVQTKVPISKH